MIQTWGLPVEDTDHPLVDGLLGGWIDGWMDGWMDGLMGGWMDGWMDGLMGEWMGGWMDWWVDGWVEKQKTHTRFSSSSSGAIYLRPCLKPLTLISARFDALRKSPVPTCVCMPTCIIQCIHSHIHPTCRWMDSAYLIHVQVSSVLRRVLIAFAKCALASCLSVCVCACTCACACVCACLYVCMCVCLCMCACACVCVLVRVHVCWGYFLILVSINHRSCNSNKWSHYIQAFVVVVVVVVVVSPGIVSISISFWLTTTIRLLSARSSHQLLLWYSRDHAFVIIIIMPFIITMILWALDYLFLENNINNDNNYCNNNNK